MTHTSLRSTLLLLLTAACGGAEPEDPLDLGALQQAAVDSAVRVSREEAPALMATAKSTLATLLDDPTSATFDSVVVIQPPAVGGRAGPLVVCGRMGGRPGVGGSRTPVRFIYQGKWTVFVEEAGNRERFAELWRTICGVEGGTVVVDER